MLAYYNEHEPYCAQWLRNLIKAGQIADGIVDERSISDVKPDELRDFTQCHFFAGIGGWSYALRLAGWPDDRRVWTGSCPCQPFSEVGQKDGFDDERHLWPDWFYQIRVNKPCTIFGEQVASKLALEWLDTVQTDLEEEGYVVGSADLCAASVGAPHKRQRLYFVANSECERVARHVNPADFSQMRPWGSFGQVDLQSIPNSPFVLGESYPQPLLRKMDDGFSTRLGRISAYGNAIVPQVAAQFIKAYLETERVVN